MQHQYEARVPQHHLLELRLLLCKGHRESKCMLISPLCKPGAVLWKRQTSNWQPSFAEKVWSIMPKYWIMLKPGGLCNKIHCSAFHVGLFNNLFLSPALSLSEILQYPTAAQSQDKDTETNKKGPRNRSHSLTHSRKFLRSSAATAQNLCWNRICNHVKFT